MSSDNVTPFRPRPKKKPVRPAGEGLGLNTHRGRAVLSQGLALIACVLNFLYQTPPMSFIPLVFAIAGVLIAMSYRRTGMPWAQTHHEHALRTIIITFIVTMLASLAASLFGVLGIVALVVIVVVTLWAAVRAAVGLVMAVMRKPIANPTGLFF